MTARAIGVFALVLAMASPALAGPANSVIGAKKLEQDMVHSGGVGYPSIMYEWWNKGKGNMDWGLGGELVYGPWIAADTDLNRFVKIGLGVTGWLRWNFISNKKEKVQNDFALLVKPGILIGGNTGNTFTFGIKGEVGLPFTIDVHERVTVVTGGFIPIGGYINADGVPNFGEIPILIRMGVEIDASEKVAPWFFFDLGPGIKFGGVKGTGFAWRIGAGTAFWGVLGGKKNKSDSSATAQLE